MLRSDWSQPEVQKESLSSLVPSFLREDAWIKGAGCLRTKAWVLGRWELVHSTQTGLLSFVKSWCRLLNLATRGRSWEVRMSCFLLPLILLADLGKSRNSADWVIRSTAFHIENRFSHRWAGVIAMPLAWESPAWAGEQETIWVSFSLLPKFITGTHNGGIVSIKEDLYSVFNNFRHIIPSHKFIFFI